MEITVISLSSSSSENERPISRKNTGHGGARTGAGKPKGAISKRLRAIGALTERAMKRVKKVPLETMLKNMTHFDDEADGLHVKLSELVENGAPPKNAKHEVHMAFFDKVMELMGKMRECRLDAQRCAVDAAPFMHQRLAATTITISTETIKAPRESDMSEDELAEYYNKLRLRPTTVEPLIIIDNETGDPVHEEEDR